MTKIKLSVFAFTLLTASFAAADTITDTFTATLDKESNGLHIVVNGQFSYNAPSGGDVMLDDLTAYSLTLTSQDAYLPNSAITTYNVGLESNFIENFDFNPATDILTQSVWVNPADTLQGMFTMGINDAPILGVVGPEIGAYGGAWGPASDPPVAASTVPEPSGMIVIAGILLVGLGIRRYRNNKQD